MDWGTGDGAAGRTGSCGACLRHGPPRAHGVSWAAPPSAASPGGCSARPRCRGGPQHPAPVLNRREVSTGGWGWQHMQPLGWAAHPCPAPPGTVAAAAPGQGEPRGLEKGCGCRGHPPRDSRAPPAVTFSCCWLWLASDTQATSSWTVLSPCACSWVPRATMQPPGRVAASVSPRPCPQLHTPWPARPQAGGPHTPALGGLGPPSVRRYKPTPHFSPQREPPWSPECVPPFPTGLDREFSAGHSKHVPTSGQECDLAPQSPGWPDGTQQKGHLPSSRR